jgi:hypothetical protein
MPQGALGLEALEPHPQLRSKPPSRTLPLPRGGGLATAGAARMARPTNSERAISIGCQRRPRDCHSHPSPCRGAGRAARHRSIFPRTIGVGSTVPTLNGFDLAGSRHQQRKFWLQVLYPRYPQRRRGTGLRQKNDGGIELTTLDSEKIIAAGPLPPVPAGPLFHP